MAKRSWTERIELNLKEKYDRNIVILSWLPFHYVDLGEIKLTQRGRALIDFLEEDPSHTYEQFQERWNQMWRR